MQTMTRPWPFEPILDHRTAQLIAENDSNNEKNSCDSYVAFAEYKHPEKNEGHKNQDKALLVQIGDERH